MTDKLDKAYGGCTCVCCRQEGVMHAAPYRFPEDESTTQPTGEVSEADREAARNCLLQKLYEAWPCGVVSPAVADATGLPIGAELSYEEAKRFGFKFPMMERYADAVLASTAQAQAEIARLKARVDHLEHVIDRDRYVVAAGTSAIRMVISGRAWLLEGRGPYVWDDDDYRKEFAGAIHDIEAAMEPLSRVAWDKSDCTKIEDRVNAAREAARELLKQPIGPREAIEADLGLADMRDVKIRQLQARVAELEMAMQEIYDLQREINPSNYDHEGVCFLNKQFVYTGTIAKAALKGTGQ